MTEPSGYTALDLIGFTDKGTYDATASYVKNDLVHYYGVWRCLVDDTTGITPVEGTNWTLFVGEPTSTIEGIIAPIETNPATDSYAVGRQFLYNDALYEVIVAITAGDALVAYEDDPDNANIQLADPVETQLLDFEEKAYATDDTTETDLASDDLVPFYDTSAAAKRQMTVANMIGQTVSNPNLLDNPWFTINQRGETSLTATVAELFVDRWKARYLTADVVDNGIQLTRTGEEANAFGFFFQTFQASDLEDLLGKTVTLSIDVEELSVTQGYLYILVENATGASLNNTTVGSLTITETGIYSLTFTMPESLSNDWIQIAIGFNVTDQSTSTPIGTATIRSIKLEVGSVSTLALDTVPNYATELLKCQRYYTRYTVPSSRAKTIAYGYASDTTTVRCSMALPCEMRTTPTITASDVTSLRIKGNGQSLTPSAISVVTTENNIVDLDVTITGATISQVYVLCDVTVDTYIEFSADL